MKGVGADREELTWDLAKSVTNAKLIALQPTKQIPKLYGNRSGKAGGDVWDVPYHQ